WRWKKERSQLGGGAEARASASTPLPLTPAPLTLALPEKPPPVAFPDHLRVTPLAFMPRSRALLPAVRPFTRYWPRMVTLSALSDSVPLTSGDPDRDPTTATWPLGRSNVPSQLPSSPAPSAVPAARATPSVIARPIPHRCRM